MRKGPLGGRCNWMPVDPGGEGGDILAELKTDGLGVFACMLGGDNGRTLFACVAPTFNEVEASRNHRAAIWMTDVEVPRAGLP